MRRLWGALVLGCLAGCTTGTASSVDSGSDGSVQDDAGSDAGVDAGPPDASSEVDAGVDGGTIVEPVLMVDAGTWSQLTWPAYSRVPAYFRDPVATDSATAISTTVVPWREFSRPVGYDGGLYYFGGGHSGYSGNDLMRFDTVSGTWSQLYRPHVPPADDSTYSSGGSERVYLAPDSGAWEPYVVHNYARSTYLPGRGYAVMIRCPSDAELASRDSGVTETPFGLATYDEVAGTWSCDTRIDDSAVIVNTGEYDPDLGGLLGFGTRYDYTVFSAYRDAGWVALKTFTNLTLAPPGSGGQQSLYVPELHGHLLFLMPQGGSFAPRITFFDSRALTVTDVPVPAALLRDAASEGAMAAAYDGARHDVVLFVKWGSGSRVWRSGLSAWNFELENDRGPDFSSTGAPDRTAVLYDAHTNAFYFLGASGDDTTTGKWAALGVWKYVR